MYIGNGEINHSLQPSLNLHYRRAHFHVQELFTDPAQLMTGGVSQGGFDMFQQQQQQMGYSGIQATSSGQGYSSQSSGGSMAPNGIIPMTALTTLGVAAEAVGQISELKNYLSRQVVNYFIIIFRMSQRQLIPLAITRIYSTPHPLYTYHSSDLITYLLTTSLQFGLDLVVTQLGGSDYHHTSPSLGAAAAAPVVQERRSSPDEVTFQIPRHSVGGIIGKGGNTLKDLQAEFGIRVYVEREEVAGMRLVVLKPLSNTEPAGELERAAIQRCQERIMALSVQEQVTEMKE